MNNDNKTTRELALEWWNSWLTPEESLAQENKELKEENKLLREALKPFAKLANECLRNSNLHKDQDVYAYNKATITMQDLRNVESALNQ